MALRSFIISPVSLLPGSLLLAGVDQGRGCRDHLLNDDERRHEHDGRGQQQHADRVGDERVVPDVGLV